MAAIGRAVEGNLGCSLTYIDLSATGITVVGLSNLVQGVSGLPGLHTVCLNDNNLAQEGRFVVLGCLHVALVCFIVFFWMIFQKTVSRAMGLPWLAHGFPRDMDSYTWGRMDKCCSLFWCVRTRAV